MKRYQVPPAPGYYWAKPYYCELTICKVDERFDGYALVVLGHGEGMFEISDIEYFIGPIEEPNEN